MQEKAYWSVYNFAFLFLFFNHINILKEKDHGWDGEGPFWTKTSCFLHVLYFLNKKLILDNVTFFNMLS